MIKTSIKIGKLLVLFLITCIFLSACNGGKSAGQYYKEGMKYMKQEAYKEAADSFANAVKRNSDRAEYYISYGMSLIKTSQYEEALVQFDKAIIDKDNQIVRENNKKAYRGKGITYLESNQFDLAIDSFAKALEIDELDKLNLDILSYKADAEIGAGKYEDAMESYTRIIEIDKKNADSYAKRAQIETQLGKTKEAIADYDKAISLDKNNYDFYFGEYFLYIQAKDTKGAKAALEKALTLKAKTEEDNYNVAKIHFYQEDYATAKSELTELVDKKYTDAYFLLGRISEVESDLTKAVSYYENYINTDTGKHSAEAYNQLGICYLQLEEYEKALNVIQMGLDIKDSSWLKVLSYNQIAAMEHLAQYEEALTKAKAYLKLYPEDESMLREYQFIQTRVDNKESKDQ